MSDLRVKHGARWQITLTDKATGRILESAEGEVGVDEIMSREFYSLLYNAAGVSGGILWRHPTTGEMFPGGLSYHLEVPLDPDDLLEGDALCDCPRCQGAS